MTLKYLHMRGNLGFLGLLDGLYLPQRRVWQGLPTVSSEKWACQIRWILSPDGGWPLHGHLGDLCPALWEACGVYSIVLTESTMAFTFFSSSSLCDVSERLSMAIHFNKDSRYTPYSKCIFVALPMSIATPLSPLPATLQQLFKNNKSH